MKTLRNHLISLGAAGVLMLGAALAQDPAAADPAAAPAPAAPVPGLVRPPILPPRTVTPRTVLPMPSGVRRPTGAPAADSSSSEPAKPTLSKNDIKPNGKMPGLKYKKSLIEIVLMDYALVTGKTLITSPGAQAQLKTEITLESQEGVPLTREEYLDAIEAVLSMNGIVLEPYGEKFVKVLPLKTVRSEGGLGIQMDLPEGGYSEKSKVVSQMIQLKYIAVSEAQKAIEGFKRPDGLIQTFERTNSMLVTDTQENVNRMAEIIKFIDQPIVVTEEVKVRDIIYAKADDIKKRLEEIVAESQKQNQAKEEIKANASGAPGFTRTTPTTAASTLQGRPLPPGLSRLTTPQPVASTPNETLETLVSDADRGMIRGKVQIVSDERSNKLIIITRKENMDFFENIISVLDIPTSPDVKVEVQRMEFADAEEVATMLNDLIGNATSKKDDSAPAGAAQTPPGAPNRSATLAEAAAARLGARTASASATEGDGKSKLGQLSKDNIKILADKRTNAIVMMGSPSDLLAIKEIIKRMDIQLAQVLIETVVISVELGRGRTTGVDWIKRIKPTTELQSLWNPALNEGAGGYETRTVERDSSYRYGVGGGGGTGIAQNLWDIGTNMVSFGGGGLEYMASLKNLRLDAVINASENDSRTKVITSPVLLTVDNKEASIEATSMRYLYKGVRYSGGGNYGGNTGNYNSGYEVPDFEQRDIGLTVKVTPRINPKGTVVLTIEETFETVGPNQEVGVGQSYPTVNTRKIAADISMENGQTVILGGLVQNEVKHSEAGIPLLKDIPFIGKYLFGKTIEEENRTELLVFMTPYVINTPEDMDREARRRKDYVNAPDIWTKGWSASNLADPVPEKEMKKRLAQKESIEKAWQNYRKSLEAHRKVDERIIDERIQTETLINQAAEEAADLEEASRAAASESIGSLRVTESVEVLGPRPGAEDALRQGADGKADAEESKKKPWFKRIF
ncbi:MAG: hypothetical protein LBW77_02725 [Verrucomicrobiota bacterium]|jgi:general secretion pathway protein D|nr:hypothetical protein [Verrucomicrobiota bacterium]